MTGKLAYKTRYLQIAFNYDAGLVRRVLPGIAYSERLASVARSKRFTVTWR